MRKLFITHSLSIRSFTFLGTYLILVVKKSARAWSDAGCHPVSGELFIGSMSDRVKKNLQEISETVCCV